MIINQFIVIKVETDTAVSPTASQIVADWSQFDRATALKVLEVVSNAVAGHDAYCDCPSCRAGAQSATNEALRKMKGQN